MPTQPAQATRIGVQVAPVASAGSEEGTIGCYRIEAELGRGGMGVVYRAIHVHLDRSVALKVLNEALAHDPDFRERFVHEARIAASLRHPHVIAVHDAGEEDGRLYMAVEHVPGSDLAGALAAGPLQPKRVLRILEQVASGLDAVHERGLVHRDVKPANILLQGDHAYLNDFGLAKRTEGDGERTRRTAGLTRKGDIVGTLDYMAPEQIEGAEVGPYTDVYALGCVLYHCLAGGPPYQHDSDVAVMFAHVQQPPPSLAEVRSDLPVAVGAVVERAMAKKPEERFATCDELVEALRDALSLRATAPAGPTVLVGTADDPVRMLIRGALAVNDFRVVEEEDPLRLPELAEELAPDVVIAQWAEMGDQADDVFRQIRTNPRSTRTRLIAIGPRVVSPDVFTAIRDHTDDYLMRPFSPVHLLMKVGDLGTARDV